MSKKTYTVGVIEFASVDPDEGGIGGFDWRTTPEELEKALHRLARDVSDYDTELVIGLVDLPERLVPNGDFDDLRPSERHAITEFIEWEIQHSEGMRNRQRLVILASPSWPGAEMRRVLRLVHAEEDES